MMLGIYKNCQQKVFDEICSNSHSSEFSLDFLNNFPYLEAVIKETMRLYTVVPLIMRQSSEDVDIDGCLIPKDTVLIMSLDAMHKDEGYWGSDAQEFKPERFLEELMCSHAFAPFAGL
jgi:cytochrome P450